MDGALLQGGGCGGREATFRDEHRCFAVGEDVGELLRLVCGFTTMNTPPASSVPKIAVAHRHRVVEIERDAFASLEAAVLQNAGEPRAPS